MIPKIIYNSIFFSRNSTNFSIVFVNQIYYFYFRFEKIILKYLTTGLNHEWKVSCNGWLDPQGQGHDWEGNGTSTLWCHAADGGAKDHGDGEEVAVGEVCEKICSLWQGTTCINDDIDINAFLWWIAFE